MWVRQSGRKANRFLLVNILNGNIIRIVQNTASLVDSDGSNSHACVLITSLATTPLFIGSEARCLDAIDQLVRYIDSGAHIAWAASKPFENLESNSGIME